MGNTVATTDQWANRRDEYDYTDYGVPIHAPIIYDGRSVASIAPHGSHADVSVVTLSAYIPVPETASLVGREFRVVKKAPSSAEDVYLAGTVIANMGSVIHIHDPGNAIAAAWDTSGVTTLDRELTAVFDLHEGFVKGVVDSKSTGTWNLNGWNEACVYLRVDLAPF
ncbi:MAG: hypothetical protein H6841_06650 [Planctomycetes bacterium]|nr:hypothetical protein [Planctomycetota bacterium]